MKISPTTIALLKNFATINQSIVIKPGSLLATMDIAPAIRAMVTVPEEFPVSIAIYDLQKFLGILAMMGDCDVEFKDNKAVLKSGKQRVNFMYSNASLLKEASTRRPKNNELFNATLSDKDILSIIKSSAVLSANIMSIVAENGVATLYIGTPKSDNFGSSADSFQMDLGPCDKEFDIRIPMEIFKVIPGAYKLSVDANLFIHLASVDTSLEYWIAAQPDSKV